MSERGRLSSRLSARETLTRSVGEEAGAGGRKPRPAKGRGSWAHAQNQSTGQAVPPNGFAEERRARGAPEPAHAPWPRPARTRARGRRSIFSSDPPPSCTSTRGGDRREQGSVGRGGRGVARERGQQKEGRGRDPRLRYRVNTQSGAGLTPPPTLTLLARNPPYGRGRPWGWGGQGAGRRRKALAGSDGGG